MRTLIRVTFFLCLALLVSGTSGCGYINKVMARYQLNDGVREYNNGNFKAAEDHFQKAKEIYPDDTRAWLFYAQSLNAQIPSSGDNKVIATKAIDAFKEALKHDPKNDVIYAFIAHIYGNVLGDQTEQFNWQLQRANLEGVKPDVKRDVYYNIGVNKWQDAYPITTKWADLTKGPTRADDPKYHIYLRPDMPADERKKAEDATNQGLQYLDQALKIDPEYANAYSYVALLNREQAKLADKDADKTKFLADYQKNIDKFQELNKKAAATQAAAPAAEPAKK